MIDYLISLEEIRQLAEVAKFAQQDQTMATNISYLLTDQPTGNEDTWAEMTIEFWEAVDHLIAWGDLDSHTHDESLQEWKLDILPDVVHTQEPGTSFIVIVG